MSISPRHSRHASVDPDHRLRKLSLDPATPTHPAFAQNDMDMIVFSSGGMASGGMEGLGNLADELADALSDGDDDDEYYNERGEPGISIEGSDGESAWQSQEQQKESGRDSGVDVENQTNGRQARHISLNWPTANGHGQGHRRAESVYDGREYGSGSDLELPGMPTSLVARMDAVELLARIGVENSGSSTDGAFKRVTDGLRDLGSQSGVEGGASRLITAHSALTTHLAHQTRQLHNLTFPLLSPLLPPPEPEVVEDVLPMLVALLKCMPRPTTAAYNQLTRLHSATNELVQTLSYLSDTLHMSRQTTTAAARRLKSARETVAEMRREDELREQGEQWISRGNWSERLEKRECAAICSDVIGGFEDTCNGWKAKLLASLPAKGQA